MTILETVQSACSVLGLDVPSALFSSSEREHVELQYLANEMATRIAKAHEWQVLNTIATYTGDASTTDFSLPSDFDRMPKKAQLWHSSLQTPLTPVPDRDAWLEQIVHNFTFTVPIWIIYGGQIHIRPAMATAVTAKHWYQSNLIIDPASGSNKTAFTIDTDVFRIDERLLKLGIIWQWKANKGLAYAQDQDAYEDLLEKLTSDDKGSRMIRIGSSRVAKDVQIAYPGTLSA